MDPRTKLELLSFIEKRRGHVGDLGWIRSPQRKFHRHELFGSDVASVLLGAQSVRVRVKDLSYGGVGLDWSADCAAAAERAGLSLRVGMVLEGEMRILDRQVAAFFDVRQLRGGHLGCEFESPGSEALRELLAQHIPFMDAGLFVRQTPREAVFPGFQGDGWLNLTAHHDAIRFDVRRPGHDACDPLELSLLFSFDGSWRYCSFRDDRIEIGSLSGAPLEQRTPAWRDAARESTAILIGLRQGAAMPDFGLVVDRFSKELAR